MLFLCFSNENMEFMIDHETLLGTVSRTLRDDFKKSLELTLYLLNVFQAYSNYTQFHEFLLQNQIGDTTVKIIEYEIKRYVVRVNEFKNKMEELEKSQGKPEYDKMLNHMRKEERKLGIMVRK